MICVKCEQEVLVTFVKKDHKIYGCTDLGETRYLVGVAQQELMLTICHHCKSVSVKKASQ